MHSQPDINNPKYYKKSTREIYVIYLSFLCEDIGAKKRSVEGLSGKALVGVKGAEVEGAVLGDEAGGHDLLHLGHHGLGEGHGGGRGRTVCVDGEAVAVRHFDGFVQVLQEKSKYVTAQLESREAELWIQH
jgi:hypothetical protein